MPSKKHLSPFARKVVEKVIEAFNDDTGLTYREMESMLKTLLLVDDNPETE